MKNAPENKKSVVVISGGTGYLGTRISDVLTKNGFVVCSVNKETVDITNEQAVKKFVEATKEEYGHIDVLIHAASAPLTRKPLLSLSEEDFTYQLAVTVTGAFNLCKHCKEIMAPNACVI